MVYGYVTTTGGSAIGDAVVKLYSGTTEKGTYVTGSDGFYVFYHDMPCADLALTGIGGGCASATTTLSVPAGSYNVKHVESLSFNEATNSGSVQSSQALRLDLKPTAKFPPAI